VRGARAALPPPPPAAAPAEFPRRLPLERGQVELGDEDLRDFARLLRRTLARLQARAALPFRANMLSSA
jgi:hypothetical protein